MNNTIKMTDLDFFTVCVSVKSKALCIVFEPASTIYKKNYSYAAE